jgi:peptidyl-prolyl cis-trans isomerase SurA
LSEQRNSLSAYKVIYSFAKSTVKGSDWLNFVKDYKTSGELYQGETNEMLLQKYINITALEYYKEHLEEYNADFKYQMQEFKEGNMLFEIMERNVWSKASNDAEGLQKTYAQNKANYRWSASADILLFNCKDEKAAGAQRKHSGRVRIGKNCRRKQHEHTS